MKNIYTWAAKPAKRTLTVGDLKAAKGKRKFTQVTANSDEEADAAEKAGFDMIISNAKNVIPVREGILTSSTICRHCRDSRRNNLRNTPKDLFWKRTSK